jgi:hypothetical protein
MKKKFVDRAPPRPSDPLEELTALSQTLLADFDEVASRQGREKGRAENRAGEGRKGNEGILKKDRKVCPVHSLAPSGAFVY